MTDANALMRTARHNYKHLKYSTIISNIDGSDYALRIAGIGNKTIKLELYIDYERIMKYHHHKHLENVLFGKINTVY